MTPERHRQIATLYHASVDLTSGERTAFLETACAGDLTLRQEVESLLAFQERAGGFLEVPPSDAMAELLTRDRASLTDGQIIGHYRIVRLLGEGGMGEVYLADDINLGRRVALKLLPSQFTRDADRLRRFKHEARAIAALNHPNIITIFEIGETDGIHFIATEFIDGQTLRQRMNSKTMKPSEAVEIATHVASALIAAHDSSVVHRDIKPENIMVRKDGLVKVLDFGLAKFAEASTAGVETRLSATLEMTTNAGMVMGTVRYMSPEQARGMKLDARSDLFSLGVVLYEMLAGQSPFADATTADEVAAILGREAPPITLPFQELQKGLQRVLTMALRKEREERYQTAQQMLDDLKRLAPVLEAETELTTVPSRSAQMPKAGRQAVAPERTRALPRAAVALALLILTSFAAWMFLSGGNGAPAPATITSLAILPLVNLSNDPEQEYFADGMTEALTSQFAQLGSLRVPGRTSVMRYKSTTKSVTEIAAELRVDALIEGSIQSSGGKVRITVRVVRAGQDERSLPAQEYFVDAADELTVLHTVARDIAREIRIQVTPSEQQRLARAEPGDPEAHRAYMLGVSFAARGTLEGYEKALAEFAKAQTLDRDYAAPWAGMADTYIDLGYAGAMEPTEAYEAARAAANEALGRDRELAEAHVSLGAVLNDYDWNWAEAESHYKRALDFNPNYATGHWSYATHLAARGRFPEAKYEAQRAARDLEPDSIKANFTAGDVYYFAGDYQSAIDSYQRVINLDEKHSPIYEALAIVYEITGKPELALTNYLKFLKTGGVEDAQIEAFKKAYGSAGVPGYLRKLLEMEEEDEKLPPHRVWPLRRASLYARLGDKEQALHWIGEAFDARNPHLQDLGVDPVFDSLQKDPRFQEYLKRLKFPAGDLPDQKTRR
jgi:serine/threonine-protein kinase